MCKPTTDTQLSDLNLLFSLYAYRAIAWGGAGRDFPPPPLFFPPKKSKHAEIKVEINLPENWNNDVSAAEALLGVNSDKRHGPESATWEHELATTDRLLQRISESDTNVKTDRQQIWELTELWMSYRTLARTLAIR